MFSSIKPFPQFILTDYVTAHHTDDHSSIFWPCIMTTRLLALLLGMASSGRSLTTTPPTFPTHWKLLWRNRKLGGVPEETSSEENTYTINFIVGAEDTKARAERHRAWQYRFHLPMVTPGLYLLKLLKFEHLGLSKEHSFPFLELLPRFSSCC